MGMTTTTQTAADRTKPAAQTADDLATGQPVDLTGGLSLEDVRANVAYFARLASIYGWADPTRDP